jgi:hypothetical protein
MKIQIPTIKKVIVLSADWNFTLYSENRNWPLGIVLGLYDRNAGWRVNWKNPVTNLFDERDYHTMYTYPVTIPAGSLLRVERIYIRNGNTEFDSVTFIIQDSPNKAFLKKRFWAKLDDVNNIEYSSII